MTLGANGIEIAFAASRVEDPELRFSMSDPTKPEWIQIQADQGQTALPEGARELSDQELLATWGSDWAKREVQVRREYMGQPCDPLPDDEDSCAGTSPHSSVSCEPATMPGEPLWRGTVTLPDGIHRVAAVPRPPYAGDAMVSQVSTLPSCWDAVTGAILEASACGRARFRDGQVFGPSN